MNSSAVHLSNSLENRPAFTTTRWSVVLSAQNKDSPDADRALEALCRAYWYPLYAFVRRRGFEVPDAQDLTQEFFARLLENDFLRSVDRTKGRFRSFLLAALEHFLANEWRRTRTRKRGGRFAFISLETETAEDRHLQLPSSTLSPDEDFDQQWAMVLLQRVLTSMQQEFEAAGKGLLFEEIKVFLTGEKSTATYAELAARLGMSEGALKMTVSRLRRRYREYLRTEIGQTVGCAEDVDDELRALFAALNP
jgi:RNA polymerase sigma-70 factor (ECF subfamily)